MFNTPGGPRSIHRNPSRPSTLHRDSNGLGLRDIYHPSAIDLGDAGNYVAHDDKGSSYDDDDDDDWEIEREYVDVGAADAAAAFGAPIRPHQVHRESQDVEFGNRLTSMRSLRGRGRPWEVNMRMPHMKGLSRGKTALLKTLRGGLRRAHGGHTHSNGSPPFEFRDPQPAPQSIRQQYAELAPSSDHTVTSAAQEMRTENGLLAPPVSSNNVPSQTSVNRTSLIAPDADAERRHSRSYSASVHSQSRPRSSTAQRLRPRSRSVGSRRSVGSEHTMAAARSAHAHDEDNDEDGVGTAETTLVQHVNNLSLTPIHLSPSKSARSSKSKFTVYPRRDFRVPTPTALARPRSRRPSRPTAALIRAWKAFNRLPWMAGPEDPPGALLPVINTPQRIAKDFIPARSDRAKLRINPPGTGLVYKKKGIRAEELEDGENTSWYRPGTRQVQRMIRAQHYQQPQRARGLGVGGMSITRGVTGPVKQAYASYRATTRNGRPLDYMYAPSPSRSGNTSTSTGTGVVAPSLYSTHQYSYSGHSRANGNAALYGLGSSGRGSGSIATAASAYLTRSASASQASSGSGRHTALEYPGFVNASAAPPPVPPKSSGHSHGYSQAQPRPQAQPLAQSHSQRQAGYPYANVNPASGQPVAYYTYNFAYPQPQSYAHTRVPGSSPSLPPVPASVGSMSYGPQSIPTIPTPPSAPTPASYSYTNGRRHGHGHSHGQERSTSGSSTESGYGTISQGAPQYANYAYVHA